MGIKTPEMLKMDKKMLIIFLANTGLVAMLLAINFLLFTSETTLFSSINLISAFIFALPIVLVKYISYQKAKDMEDLFPVFLRDFVESIRGGMTLPASLKAVSENDYKSLTPYIKKMSAQLDWGIPVERVLMSFAKSTKSKLIIRVISSVRESHRFGGNLADTFEALSNTAVEVDRLREERRLYLNSQMITGYIVFFVFLGVMIGLEKFLVPSLSQVSPMALTNAPSASTNENIGEAYKELFRNLILIQGLFAGLAVGKMAEGAMMGGVKHSLFMMFVGALIFTVAG